MKEIRTIVNTYNEIDFTRNKAALVTLVGLEGSSYRRMGARMLVLDNGIYIGGISGGCLEGDALKRAQLAIIKEMPSIVRYDTTQDDDYQVGVGLGCNGIIDVLFVPLNKNDISNPLNILATIIDTRDPYIFLTIIQSKNRIIGRSLLYENEDQLLEIFENAELTKLILKDIEKCEKGQSSSKNIYKIPDDEVHLFIEFIIPETRLVIFGSNNDVKAITSIANELGWKVILVTNILKVSRMLFDMAFEVLDSSSPFLDRIDSFTAVVLMTHDFKMDASLFPEILKTSAQYIGILGPKKRAQRLFNESKLQLEVLADSNKSRVFAPTGLDIGANTPEEIALSIIAEIRAKFASREGGFLKLRKGSIYEE